MAAATSHEDNTRPSDPTFRGYTRAQAEFYKKVRRTYSKALYDFVLDHHGKTGGSFESLLDIGCGPGNSTAEMAGFFDRVTGLDPSPGMIEAAKKGEVKSRAGTDIEYVLGAAEDVDKLEGIDLQSIDLVTAATSAHWFDLPKFWPAVAKVLKPGGTVAFWTRASLFCHPATPSAEMIQSVLLKLERETLAPYETGGNHMSRIMYESLKLPWDLDPPLHAFTWSDFVRREWDRDGVLSDGYDFFGGSNNLTLGQVEHALSTSSMVTRWREAHPDLAGTAQDCVVQTIDEVADILAPGSGRSRETAIRGGVSTVVLMVKKRHTAVLSST